MSILQVWLQTSRNNFTTEDIAKIRGIERDLIERRKLFDNEDFDWKDISEFDKSIIPNDFNIDVINTFLRSTYIPIGDKMFHSEIDKPSVKGRELYSSEFVQRCQITSTDHFLIFRAEIAASMKDIIR